MLRDVGRIPRDSWKFMEKSALAAVATPTLTT